MENKITPAPARTTPMNQQPPTKPPRLPVKEATTITEGAAQHLPGSNSEKPPGRLQAQGSDGERRTCYSLLELSQLRKAMAAKTTKSELPLNPATPVTATRVTIRQAPLEVASGADLTPRNPTNERRMSSLDIARLTDKEHTHVMRDIERDLNEVGIDVSQFGCTYIDVQGNVHPCYHLPRRECDLITSGYSHRHRPAIIGRWQELETDRSIQTASIYIETLRRYADELQAAANVQTQLEMATQRLNEAAPANPWKKPVGETADDLIPEFDWPEDRFDPESDSGYPDAGGDLDERW